MKDTVNEAAAQKAAGGSRLKDGGGHGALIALGVTGGLLAALVGGNLPKGGKRRRGRKSGR